ncbi:GNAT family N-acetyltransferase [Paenibacillus sp. L3-i20]|uniref:GNAT family N-acetyltransferase n=1 Tax=Paenibacillus sp. L3-i20 TaxID=2905833 RepID=UPI0020865C78|nr:GNAT family N-acetyltransferase [Paenibacillus sp. L3-i20]GKU76320.1 N-acetyltransferase [Paenibacillus sp. L3-i20]
MEQQVNQERLMIESVPSNNLDLAMLIERLDHYLLELYVPEDINGVDFNDPKTKDMIFVVAYWDGVPVGCGGIRQLDANTAELKRFFVESAIRRQGIAGKVLKYLEQCAVKLGCTVMKLETGAPQVESVAFYKKQGFYEIEPFGEYEESEASLCMEKRIEAFPQ